MPDRELEIDGISKRYGETVAVQDLSFRIRAGELFGFVGRNGAGKTTTMRIMLGVLTPDSGVVRWAGAPLDLATRRRIGYMPEERGLYPKMRAAEQIAYLGELHGMPDADARAAAGRWLDRFGLAERRNDELQAFSLGQPATDPTRGCARFRARGARAGRAVCRARSHGRGRHERRAPRAGQRRPAGHLLQPRARARRAAL